MRELDEIRAQTGGCETGSAAVTGAGRLPATYVFHAVGPRYRDGKHQEAELLAGCYRTCLDLAAERDVRTISFPSISTGIYGFPIEAAAEIAMRTIANWLAEHAEPIRVIKLIQFSDADHQVYRRHAQSMRSGASASG
jgi:O-acetyl-ADP-ribose deacetylase (regulator of RNase III)